MNTKFIKSDIYIIIIYFVVDFAISIKQFLKEGLPLAVYFVELPVELITTCAVIFLFIYWTIPKFVLEKKYLLFTFAGVGTMVLFGGIKQAAVYWARGYDWANFPTGINFVLSMINSCTQEVSFLFALLLSKKFYEGQTQFLKIEKEKKENELKLLRSQIDPHFLFNNLNTLDSLIDSNSDKAKEYINRLSHLYRYLIRTKDAEVMELAEEIQLAENYIFLIKTRFDQDYIFEIIKNTSLEDKFIPTGALQTLLENVVKHNKPFDKPIKSVIEINDQSLKVWNTKSKAIVQKESFGTGLENLKIRYQLLSDQEVLILDEEASFSITIPIIQLLES